MGDEVPVLKNEMISYRVALIVRPDPSYRQLLDWRAQGFEEVAFIANLEKDQQCAVLDRNRYKISDLLRYDNPLYRTSHPNCNCKFEPIGQPKTQTKPQAATTPVGINEKPQEGQGNNPPNQAGTI